MKVRKVCPEKVEQAKAVMAMVCLVMRIPEKDAFGYGGNKRISYARKLVIYSIRNEVTLQVDVIADMIGRGKMRRLVSTYYSQIRERFRQDEIVRADVNKITNALRLAA